MFMLQVASSPLKKIRFELGSANDWKLGIPVPCASNDEARTTVTYRALPNVSFTGQDVADTHWRYSEGVSLFGLCCSEEDFCERHGVWTYAKFQGSASMQLNFVTLFYVARSPARIGLGICYTQPFSFLAYILLYVGLAILSRRSTSKAGMAFGGGLMLAVIAYLLRILFQVWGAMTSYCNQCLQEDLADIPAHYKLAAKNLTESELEPSSPSGFWVAEIKTLNGPKIVGMVALGMFSPTAIVRD